MIIVLGILGALTTVFWVLMIIHAAKHVEPKRVMWIWIGIMAVTGVLGAIIYYFMVKRKMDHSLRSASASTSTNDFGIVPPVPSTTPSPAAGVSLAASAPATVTIPTSPSTAAHLKQSFTSGKGLWMIIGIVVAVNILIFAGWYFLRDTKSTPSKSTKGATIQEKTTPVPSQMYAQVGDVSQVRLSNLQKSGGIPIRMKIARIIKLLPENGKATIDLKACSG
jgi:flagellar basal body-associated protein FliL